MEEARKPIKDRHRIFMSHRVEDYPNPVPGSTKAVCGRCDLEIWVSPDCRCFCEKAHEVVCTRCLPPHEIPFDYWVPLPPEDQAELETFLEGEGKDT